MRRRQREEWPISKQTQPGAWTKGDFSAGGKAATFTVFRVFTVEQWFEHTQRQQAAVEEKEKKSGQTQGRERSRQ